MELTRDVVSDGALIIMQSKEGYRFGLDAVLLATEIPDVPLGGTVVDLGAGNGAVGLMIAKRRPDIRVICLEVQRTLVDLLERNIAENELASRVTSVYGDVRQHRLLLKPQSADLVVSNPPYYRTGQGRPSPNRERAAAHQELNGTLRDFVVAAQYVAKPRASLKLVIPPMRLSDLNYDVRMSDFLHDTCRFVHARANRDAYLMEWVFRRGGAPNFAVKPPLILHGDDDQFLPEVTRRFAKAAVEEVRP